MLLSKGDWNSYAADIKRQYWLEDMPAWIHQAVSVTPPDEKTLFYHVVRDFPEHLRRIVDAGAFTGGSALCFCRAVLDSGRPVTDNMIVSYDLFKVDQFARNLLREQRGIHVPIGSSLLPIFLSAIAGHEHLVAVVKGDITTFTWSGGPIDILFLDVMKSQVINDHCLKTFFPALEPGTSIVIQQDYIHGPLPWIPLSMEALSDHFQVLGNGRNSVVYRCTKAISPEEIQAAINRIAAMDLTTKTEIFDAIIQRFQRGDEKAKLTLSKIWMMFHHPDHEATRQAIRELPGAYATNPGFRAKLAVIESSMALAAASAQPDDAEALKSAETIGDFAPTAKRMAPYTSAVRGKDTGSPAGRAWRKIRKFISMYAGARRFNRSKG